MKINSLVTGLSLFAIAALTSCGSSSSSSSDDCFGGIPGTIASYEQESEKLTAGIDDGNYEKKEKEAAELREKTTSDVEKAAKELNGKEIPCSVDDSRLKINKPVTLVFESMNKYRPVFSLAGDVTCASDLTLNADPSDLEGETLLSGSEVVVSVKMPVALDFLDKDGKVVKHMNDIGTLEATNDGKKAVVKAGTPIDFCRNFVVDDSLAGVQSVRLTVETDKAPYTSRSLN